MSKERINPTEPLTGARRVPQNKNEGLGQGALGITGAASSKVGDRLFSRFAQTLTFVGIGLVGQPATTHAHDRSEHPTHASRAATEAHHESRAIGMGFELIGIDSRELAALISDAFPPFVYGHRRIALVEYVAEHVAPDPSDMSQPLPGHAWTETARHTFSPNGGTITIRAEAFRWIDGDFYGQETNFTSAMGTIVHEVCHAAPPRDFFRREAQRVGHLPISAYSEAFLRNEGEVDYAQMAGEMQSDFLRDLYLHAPVGHQPLRAWSIERLRLRHPQVDQALIARNVDQLFALAPGFDWDAAIGRFRKGVRNLYDQFSRSKVETQLSSVPEELRELLPSYARAESDSYHPTMAEQLTFDSRLQNASLQQHYQQFRFREADALDLEAARLTIEVRGFAALKSEWENTLDGLIRFQAYRLKNNTLREESGLLTGGTSDQALRGDLPVILASIRGTDLSLVWSRIPPEHRPAVLRLLQNDARARLHRGDVPPVIEEEARRVLQQAHLSPL